MRLLERCGNSLTKRRRPSLSLHLDRHLKMSRNKMRLLSPCAAQLFFEIHLHIFFSGKSKRRLVLLIRAQLTLG